MKNDEFYKWTKELEERSKKCTIMLSTENKLRRELIEKKYEIKRLNNIIDEIHLLFIEFDRNVMKRKYAEANMINLKIKAKLKELKGE